EASLEVSQAKLSKLSAGSSLEEIRLAETKVSNASTSLKNAEQDLEGEKNLAQESLDNALEDALNVIDDSYLKISNSVTVANNIQVAYFTGSDQESVKVIENKNKLGSNAVKVKTYTDSARANPTEENINAALTDTEKALREAADSLKIIRDNCEASSYYNKVSSTDKTSLDTQRTNINTALTNIDNAKQEISTVKLDNISAINTAQTKVDSAQGSLKTAQDELAKILAPAREADVNLAQAEIRRDQAKADNLKNAIGNTVLRSPVAGQVVKIDKRVGEIVEPLIGNSLITILPSTPFEVEADIYEEDVAKVSLDNEVDISLIAFPGKIFKGKVLSVDPVEKVIDGVVYYETTISFVEGEISEGIKPGMTADIVIKTASRENVLLIPKEAIADRDGKTTVQIIRGDALEEKEIAIGLKGSDDMVEVISGLAEGEEVAIKK
ncbi:MAG: efflux RND transporter periplasmic adaptor subunit, partial [bacterium]|nr:efflux RND transporter periplasmic adaptor subunit [bacterium]